MHSAPRPFSVDADGEEHAVTKHSDQFSIQLKTLMLCNKNTR